MLWCIRKTFGGITSWQCFIKTLHRLVPPLLLWAQQVHRNNQKSDRPRPQRAHLLYYQPRPLSLRSRSGLSRCVFLVVIGKSDGEETPRQLCARELLQRLPWREGFSVANSSNHISPERRNRGLRQAALARCRPRSEPHPLNDGTFHSAPCNGEDKSAHVVTQPG